MALYKVRRQLKFMTGEIGPGIKLEGTSDPQISNYRQRMCTASARRVGKSYRIGVITSLF